MVVETKTQTIITPEHGETFYEISKKISEEIKKGNIKGEILFNLPNGKTIPIDGTTTSEIRDSIVTKWNGDGKF